MTCLGWRKGSSPWWALSCWSWPLGCDLGSDVWLLLCVDHDPKQQNPQHFHTFILHGWWMVSTNAVIRIYHELISSQVVQIHTLRVTYSQAWQRSCDQRKHVRVTLTSLQDCKLLSHTLSCSCNISMMKLLETIHQPCKMKVWKCCGFCSFGSWST